MHLPCDGFVSMWYCYPCSVIINRTVLNLELQVCQSVLHVVVFVVNETFFCQFVLLVSEDVERDGKLISNVNVLKALLNNRPNVGHVRWRRTRLSRIYINTFQSSCF